MKTIQERHSCDEHIQITSLQQVRNALSSHAPSPELKQRANPGWIQLAILDGLASSAPPQVGHTVFCTPVLIICSFGLAQVLDGFINVHAF